MPFENTQTNKDSWDGKQMIAKQNKLSVQQLKRSVAKLDQHLFERHKRKTASSKWYILLRLAKAIDHGSQDFSSITTVENLLKYSVKKNEKRINELLISIEHYNVTNDNLLKSGGNANKENDNTRDSESSMETDSSNDEASDDNVSVKPNDFNSSNNTQSSSNMEIYSSVNDDNKYHVINHKFVTNIFAEETSIAHVILSFLDFQVIVKVKLLSQNWHDFINKSLVHSLWSRIWAKCGFLGVRLFPGYQTNRWHLIYQELHLIQSDNKPSYVVHLSPLLSVLRMHENDDQTTSEFSGSELTIPSSIVESSETSTSEHTCIIDLDSVDSPSSECHVENVLNELDTGSFKQSTVRKFVQIVGDLTYSSRLSRRCRFDAKFWSISLPVIQLRTALRYDAPMLLDLWLYGYAYDLNIYDNILENMFGLSDMSSLIKAVVKLNDLNILTYLLQEKKFNVDAVMILVCQNGRADMIKLLIRHNETKNTKNEINAYKSEMLLCIEENQPECLEIFLKSTNSNVLHRSCARHECCPVSNDSCFEFTIFWIGVTSGSVEIQDVLLIHLVQKKGIVYDKNDVKECCSKVIMHFKNRIKHVQQQYRNEQIE